MSLKIVIHMKSSLKSCAFVVFLAFLCREADAFAEIPLNATGAQVSLFIEGVRIKVIGQAITETVALGENDIYASEIIPNASKNFVRQMLVYGCTEPLHAPGIHGSGAPMSRKCKSGERLLYGWTYDAPPFILPPNVGIPLGKTAGIMYLVLEVHFRKIPSREMPMPGVDIKLAPIAPRWLSGVVSFVSTFSIPPGSRRYDVPTTCCYTGSQAIHAFAFRVHSHSLGRKVWLERVAFSGTKTLLLERDPNLVQSFVKMGKEVIIRPGDKLRATCRFDSLGREQVTKSGPEETDEMCNLYLMAYGNTPFSFKCFNDQFSGFDASQLVHVEGGSSGGGPRKKKLVLPSGRLPMVDPVPGWKTGSMGQVSGVRGLGDSIYVFQRGSRFWDAKAFVGNRLRETTFIPEPAVLVLNATSGALMHQFGENAFMMPHGITVDTDGLLWLTDCGLHQVFKYNPVSGMKVLEVGTKMTPGKSNYHFCKPTSVAVASDGSFFVADGYCNSRVVAFDPRGNYIREWEAGGVRGEATKAFHVPHSILLHECRGRVYVADRENRRIMEYDVNGRFISSLDLSEFGEVYALSGFQGGEISALAWPRAAKGIPLLVRYELTKKELQYSEPYAHLLPEVDTPHDVFLNGFVDGDTISEIFVGETRPRPPSRLHKFSYLGKHSDFESFHSGTKHGGNPVHSSAEKFRPIPPPRSGSTNDRVFHPVKRIG